MFLVKYFKVRIPWPCIRTVLLGKGGLYVALPFAVSGKFVRAKSFLEQIKTIEFLLPLLKQLVSFSSCFRVFKRFNGWSISLVSF